LEIPNEMNSGLNATREIGYWIARGSGSNKVDNMLACGNKKLRFQIA